MAIAKPEDGGVTAGGLIRSNGGPTGGVAGAAKPLTLLTGMTETAGGITPPGTRGETENVDGTGATGAGSGKGDNNDEEGTATGRNCGELLRLGRRKSMGGLNDTPPVRVDDTAS
jgi:hypothetical protein